MNEYIAYTDGSYKSSINCGGGSSIILDSNNNIIAKLYQGYKNTTNNRMEIMAVLNTLKYFKEPVKIRIVSDSMYVVGSLINGYAEKGIKENDLSKKNLDLGFDLVNLYNFHQVTMEGTKGHSVNELNNLADLLAQHASECLNLPKDIGTLNSHLKS